MSRRVVRYSEGFKQQVIMEIGRGRFRNAWEASQAYGIRGSTTVASSLEKAGRGALVRRAIKVEKPGELGEIRRLKERVRKLEAALADAHMDRALDQSFFEILCEQQGIDPARFKKTRVEGIRRSRERPEGIKGISLSGLCWKVGISRQGFYKQRRRRKRHEVDSGLIVSLVRRERFEQPRIGGRKLHGMLKKELEEAGVVIGRDRFFGVLRAHELLVSRLPSKRCRTTISGHNLPVFHNLIKDREATAPNQIWVSDITYIRTEEEFEYLNLIMDRFSRKIVGYYCSENLNAAASLMALKRALKDLPENRYPIHHSDRGCQYCSHEYVTVL